MKFSIIILSLVISWFSYGEQERPTGLNRKQFETILQQFQEIFSPLSQEMGKELLITSYWDIGWELALPSRRKEQNMNSLLVFGGLAKHPLMNEEALILALCHEMGHFFGGPPYYQSDPEFSWSSLEGQADYFATAFCTKTYYRHRQQFPPLPQLSRAAQILCQHNTSSHESESICQYSVHGAQTLGQVLSLISQKNPMDEFPEEPTPQLSTSSTEQVPKTLKSYPSLQCRFDTWMAGALCNRKTENLSLGNLQEAYCSYPIGIGKRPACWFAD